MALSDDILDAAEAWKAMGWYKGGILDPAGISLCAIGVAEFANAEVCDPDARKARYRAVVRALDQEVRLLALPFKGIVHMNDHPRTTFAMMMAVFWMAAVRAQSYERALDARPLAALSAGV